MRITVLGAGHVGATLATAWQAAGHEVRLGVRDPDAERYEAVRHRLSIGDVGPALESAEVVLFAVPGANLSEVLNRHAVAIDGRVVIDATNRMGRTVMHQVPMLVHRLPTAAIFRGFCSVGHEVLAEPVLGGETADLLFVGPDGPARGTVETLVRDVGMRPVWIGGTDAADALDSAARLWFALVAERGMGRRVALRVIADGPVA